MRAVKSVTIDSERRVIITYLDGSTETLYPNCIWCDAEALRDIIKELLEEKADAIVQTINNVTVATFEDGADEALIRKLLVSIDPIQDLHGYDSPWPAGGGKNLLENTASTTTTNGLTFTVYDDGTVSVSGTATADTWFGVGTWIANGEQIVLNGCPNGGSSTTYRQFASFIGPDVGNGASGTPQGGQNCIVSIQIYNGYTVDNLLFKPMIRLASNENPRYVPYSNICPISGRTGLTVYRTGSDTSNPTEFPVTWETEARTVYGGTLDVVSGKLNIDRVSKTFVGATDEEWLQGGANPYFYCALENLYAGINSEVICDTFPNNGRINGTNNVQGVYTFNSSVYDHFNFYLRWSALGINTVTQFRQWLSTNNVTICYKLSEPIEYQIEKVDITTLLGSNNIWADSGDILELEYVADTKLYIGETQSGTLGSGKQSISNPDLHPVSEKTVKDMTEVVKAETIEKETQEETEDERGK